MIKWLSWLPALGWCSLIFFLSSQPGGPEPSWWFPQADKVIHAGLYGMQGLLFYVALRCAPGWRAPRAARAAFALAVLYGASDEFHQSFIPKRNSALSDVAADALGAAGVLVVSRWSRR